MQIPSIQAPVPVTALLQDAAKAVPQVQAQAAPPLIQRAVDPSPRSERGTSTRSNSEKGKGEQAGEDKRGGSLNIRV